MNDLIFVNIFSNNEGAESFLYNLLKEFSKKCDYSITLLDNGRTELSNLENIERIPIRTIERNFSFALILQTINCIRDIRKALKGLNKAIVLLNGERAMYLAAFLPMSNSFIGIKHMSIEGKLRIFKRIAFIFSILFNRKIITISQYHRTILSRFLPKFLVDKIKIIYLGIDCDNRFLPTNQKYKEPFAFVIVGSLVERKGHLDLMDAFSRIVNQVNCHLYVVGMGHLQNNLIDIVNQKKLEKHVTFLGQVNNVEVVYKRCHAFILPSYSEGMPLSIIEAFSCELPVISTNIVGIPEVVSPNVNGFLIEPGDRNKLAEYMIHLAKNPEIAHKMGVEGRKLICSKFSRDRMIEEYQNLFAQI